MARPIAVLVAVQAELQDIRNAVSALRE